MSRVPSALRWAGALLALTGTTACAGLRCGIDPPHPVLGRRATWTLTARDLRQPLPAFTAAQFAPDWLLQDQQGSSGSVAGHREQALQLTLYPLRAGRLPLPAVAAGGGCAQRSVVVADHAPGETALSWRTRMVPARPYRLESVRIELIVPGSSDLAWDPPEARSDALLLTPLGSQSRSETVDGRRQLAQVFRWDALPLRSGPVQIDFGVARAHAFGSLRVYAPPPLRFDVRALPLWWPADGLVGRPTIDRVQAPDRWPLGRTAVWRLRLRGAGLDRRQARAVLDRWSARWPRDLGLATLDLRAGEVLGAWNVTVFFRPERGGRLLAPPLRVDWFDPRSGLPAVLAWTPPSVEVDDPRPARLAWGLGGTAAMLVALFALRAAVLCRRRRRLLARRLHAIATADGADALRRAWLALLPPTGAAATLEGWLDAAPAGRDPAVRAAAVALEHALYSPQPFPVGVDPADLAQRLRRGFMACGRWR